MSELYVLKLSRNFILIFITHVVKKNVSDNILIFKNTKDHISYI